MDTPTPCHFRGCKEPAAVTITTRPVVYFEVRKIKRAYCAKHAEALLEAALPGAEVAAITDDYGPS